MSNGGEASAMVIDDDEDVLARDRRSELGAGDTTVLAVTDSVLMTTTDERVREATRAGRQSDARPARPLPRGARRNRGNERARTARRARSRRSCRSCRPTFPKGPISVGESWMREMALPGGSQLGAPVRGKLHVTFRFDSLTHGGDWAFVSMRGEMHPSSVRRRVERRSREGRRERNDARRPEARLAHRVVVHASS